MPALMSPPEGLLTFLFTDVEGSTRLWAADTEGTAQAMAIHDELIKAVVGVNDGFVFGFAGDGFRAAFVEPANAVRAAKEITDGLANAPWGDAPPLRVRIGLHRGEATRRGGDYFGPVLNAAARIEDAGNGGQVLLTRAVAETLGESFELLWLGAHRLKDIADPVGIFQLGSAHHRPLRVVNPRLSNLPNLGEDLIGRDQLVNQVRTALETRSLLTLAGPGGCGKTRLAIEVAAQELPNRSDGCYFADLLSVSEPDGLAAAVAQAIRLNLTGGDAVRQIVDHLADRNALLILDNCEHLLSVCADFAEQLMGRAGQTAILATSRERLNVDGERVIQVTPLAVEVHGGPAVDFFEARAQLVNPEFAVSEGNLGEVVELCTKLDGIPLALELAAARLSVLSVKELTARLDDRLRLLTGSAKGSKGRRQTMKATLDWSYELLAPDEQRFFRALGVFIGPFSLQAATEVAGDGNEYLSIDLLQSLVGKSLVNARYGQRDGKFRLLETVRYYASDHLSQHDELEGLRNSHLEYFTAVVRTDNWIEGSDIDRARELVTQWPNISSALEWAIASEKWIEAAEIALGSQGLWTNFVSAAVGVSWLGELVQPVTAAHPELGEWLAHNKALLCLQLDDFGAVAKIFDEMSESASPEPRSQALAIRAFIVNRSKPDETLRLVSIGEQLVAENALGPESVTTLLWARANHALYAGDFTASAGSLWTGFGHDRPDGIP